MLTCCAEVRQTRTRGKAKTTQRDARQKQLEILKARRVRKGKGATGRNLEATSDDDDFHNETDADGQSEDDWHADEIRKSLRSNNDEYEADFITDDDEEPPNLEDMPLEFTLLAHKTIKEHFKDVVEWMVHKKLNPAFSRDDEIYRIAFRKVDDVVKGYAGSKFISSIWREDFQRALKARPGFNEVGESAGALSLGCQACGRSTHPATFRVSFKGKPYDPETLENLREDDDTTGDYDDDDDRSYDIDGNVLPSTEREFYIGRFVTLFPTSLQTTRT